MRRDTGARVRGVGRTHLAAWRFLATVSRSLPRHEVMPIPVTTTRFRPSTIWICAPGVLSELVRGRALSSEGVVAPRRSYQHRRRKVMKC